MFAQLCLFINLPCLTIEDQAESSHGKMHKYFSDFTAMTLVLVSVVSQFSLALREQVIHCLPGVATPTLTAKWQVFHFCRITFLLKPLFGKACATLLLLEVVWSELTSSRSVQALTQQLVQCPDWTVSTLVAYINLSRQGGEITSQLLMEQQQRGRCQLYRVSVVCRRWPTPDPPENCHLTVKKLPKT